jgi:hypothetical protein
MTINREVRMFIEVGHVYHRCHDIEEWDSNPRYGLGYQLDFPNETYYSIYTSEEFELVLGEVNDSGNFYVHHLFHCNDSCEFWLKEFFTNELVDEYGDLNFIAYLHYQDFVNPLIAKKLCTHILEAESIESIIDDLSCRYCINDEDIEDIFGNFRFYLQDLRKILDIRKFKAKLETQLVMKIENGISKI